MYNLSICVELSHESVNQTRCYHSLVILEATLQDFRKGKQKYVVLEYVYFHLLGFVMPKYNFVLLVFVQSALDGTKGGMQPHNRT